MKYKILKIKLSKNKIGLDISDFLFENYISMWNLCITRETLHLNFIMKKKRKLVHSVNTYLYRVCLRISLHVTRQCIHS